MFASPVSGASTPTTASASAFSFSLSALEESSVATVGFPPTGISFGLFRALHGTDWASGHRDYALNGPVGSIGGGRLVHSAHFNTGVVLYALANSGYVCNSSSGIGRGGTRINRLSTGINCNQIL